MKTTQLNWHLTKDKLPIETDDGQISCLCVRKHIYQRNPEDQPKIVHQIETLVFNAHYKCWDDESGDDYQSDIENVIAWTLLPTVKDVNELFNFLNLE